MLADPHTSMLVVLPIKKKNGGRVGGKSNKVSLFN